MNSLQQSKSNFLLVMSLFGVFAVGGSALFLSQNNRVNLNSGASNVEQNLKDKLVKRGTSAFSPCKNLDSKYTYALIGNGVEGLKVREDLGENNGRDGKGKPSPMPSASCTPLVVPASAAETFVGKLVLVTGTYTDGVFYATKIQDANAKPTVSPKASSNPFNNGNKGGLKPSKTPVVPPSRY